MALTPYLRLTKPPFDQVPWDQAINGDMDIIDGFIAQYMSVPNFGGTWANSTPYVVGQVLLDTSNSSMWVCQVSHTSAPAPTTFAQDRTAHPTYWMAGTVPQGFLPITGGTLTGNLNISPASGSPIINLVAPSVASRQVVGYTGGAARWVLEFGNGDAESGSNAGSNFALDRYTDAGTYLGSPITVTRSSGAIALNGNVTGSGSLTAGDITSGGALRLSTSGAYFYSDSTYTYLQQDAGGWSWRYTRANGTMTYVRGSDGGSLFIIDSNGNTTANGTITGANVTANVNVTGAYVHSTGSVMSDSGRYMVGNNPAYYFGYNTTNGHWEHRTNNVLLFDIDASGNASATGFIGARGGASYLGTSGDGVALQFNSGWYFDWNSTTHDLGWINATIGSAGFIARANGDLVANQNLYCAATGVVYANIGPDGFNFRWGNPTAYIRINNTAEIGIQPVSDERMKRDIAPSTFDCLSAVLATPLFEFRWNDVDGVEPVGFVAQRQHKVFPASVIPGGEDGASHGATTMWQMNHNTICAALVGAVQQLSARVEALEAQLADRATQS